MEMFFCIVSAVCCELGEESYHVIGTLLLLLLSTNYGPSLCLLCGLSFGVCSFACLLYLWGCEGGRGVMVFFYFYVVGTIHAV